MKTFKTQNTHNVPFGRGIINTEVFLKISKSEIDENGVIARGYYYILQDGQPHKLDDIVPSLLSWETISQLEAQLSDFSGNSLKDVIFKRAEEFARLKLQSEGTANYGINPNDWELYVEPEVTEVEPEIEEDEDTI